MTVGFKTASDTLYWIDSNNFTHRYYKTRNGVRDMDIPQACVYLTRKAKHKIALVSTSSESIYLCFMKASRLNYCNAPQQLLDADTYKERMGIAIFDRATQKLVDVEYGVVAPAVGLAPYEQIFTRNEAGKIIRHNSVGATITQIFDRAADLVAAGFPIGHMLARGFYESHNISSPKP